MKTLTCSCLNIKIHTKKTEKILNTAQLGIGSEIKEPFFTLDIADAQLDLGGITIGQPMLVRERNICDWVVHQCLNCDTLTHACHSTKLLINEALFTDITSIESSADYSPLYKMVLRNKGNDNQTRSPMLNVHSGKYEHLQKTLTSIQQQLASFIESEKRAMDERIRAYEEEQRAKFAALTSRVSQDKTALINTVLAVQEMATLEENTDILLHGGMQSPGQERPDDFSDGPQRQQQKYFNPIHSVSSGKATQVASKPKSIMKKSAGDEEDMFDLDGLEEEDDSRPFYVSDDENDDTDDSSINEEAPYSVGGRYSSNRKQHRPSSGHHNMYSQSVPISVPQQWRPGFSTHSSLEEDDESAPAPDPEDMAASIKALARSVHGDGTEIFGDLPRRRLNTMEIGKI